MRNYEKFLTIFRDQKLPFEKEAYLLTSQTHKSLKQTLVKLKHSFHTIFSDICISTLHLHQGTYILFSQKMFLYESSNSPKKSFCERKHIFRAQINNNNRKI